MIEKYLTLYGIAFENHKIIKAIFRNSYFHIKYPYVLELTYNESHIETTYIYNGYGGIPIDELRNEMDFKFKFPEKKGLMDIFEHIKKECLFNF